MPTLVFGLSAEGHRYVAHWARHSSLGVTGGTIRPQKVSATYAWAFQGLPRRREHPQRRRRGADPEVLRGVVCHQSVLSLQASRVQKPDVSAVCCLTSCNTVCFCSTGLKQLACEPCGPSCAILRRQYSALTAKPYGYALPTLWSIQCSSGASGFLPPLLTPVLACVI